MSVEGARRAYRSAVRAEQAERTRAAVIAAAGECFLRRGYAETTMKDIAERAGVSAPTVYTQGGKAALLLAAVDRALSGGDAPEPVIQHGLFRRLMTEPDKEGKLRLLEEIAIHWIPRITPIIRCFRGASFGDPEIAAAWEEYERRRLTDARAVMSSFAPLLRPGVTAERAADVFWAAFNWETSEALMRARGWSVAEYAAWMTDSVDRLLLR